MDKVIGFAVIAAVFVGIFGLVAVLLALPAMWMWDYVMPAVFGLPEITFWQALWGMLLCRFLFTDMGVKFGSK